MIDFSKIAVIANRVLSAPKYTKVSQLIEGLVWESNPDATARSVDKWVSEILKEVLKQKSPAKVEVLEAMMQKDNSSTLYKKLLKSDKSLPTGVLEVLEEINMCLDDFHD